jgi:WD40 repeat protein
VAGEHVAFMSYAQFDDDHEDGQLTEFRKRLAAEVRVQTGREFTIFQDREDVAWGQNWQERIDETLDTVTLLLVIITPGLFRSDACRAEVARFHQRERQLGRSDLILPVYYITAREMEDLATQQADELATVLASRRYADWRELRFDPVSSPQARKAIALLASRMRNAFWQPPQPSRPPAADDPYARMARNPGEVWVPHSQRSWRQPSQPLYGATRSPAPSVPYPQAPASKSPASKSPASKSPASKTPGSEAPRSPETREPSATDGTPGRATPGAGNGTGVGRATGGSPAPGGRQRAVPWWQRRRIIIAGLTAAVLAATGGTVYAVEAPRSGPAIAATLEVPDGTVDTVWISPDGKLIAAARTNQPSAIYVWNTADPQDPVTLPVPTMKVGTTVYPTMVDNIAFSADDASMTMIGYPQPIRSFTKQSYVLYQWDLADRHPVTVWSVNQTSSVLSFSSDNSTAVESAAGGATLLKLPSSSSSSAASPLALPGGSALSATTTFKLDLSGNRMLYSPAENTYVVWDLAGQKAVQTWTAQGTYFLSPDGTTALDFYYRYNSDHDEVYPPPQLLDVATKKDVSPADPRWQEQLVTSEMTDAYVTYSTDGSVIATERAGGKTDLWSSVTHQFLGTISDPSYRDDSDYVVVGPGGHEVVIFGGRTSSTGHQFSRLYLWDTRIG